MLPRHFPASSKIKRILPFRSMFIAALLLITSCAKAPLPSYFDSLRLVNAMRDAGYSVPNSRQDFDFAYAGFSECPASLKSA
jgi:hypothetical protein